MSTVSIRHDVAGASGLLSEQKAFESHGAMAAYDYTPIRTGRLPEEWVDAYRSDRESPGISYVVYSYNTPIAWVRVDGRTIVPDVGYSVTTTRHQRLCRVWL